MIRLRTLGAVDLKDSEGRELRPLLTQPKRLALLTYLALAGSSGFSRRDTVAALFWPELDEEHARGSLRQALRFLRRSLGERVIVSRGEEEIGVDRGVLRCDATAFMEACEAGRDAEALDLYQGAFLDGFFVSEAAPELERWVEDERIDLRRRAAASAWALADGYRLAGDRHGAAALARRAAGVGPAAAVRSGARYGGGAPARGPERGQHAVVFGQRRDRAAHHRSRAGWGTASDQPSHHDGLQRPGQDGSGYRSYAPRRRHRLRHSAASRRHRLHDGAPRAREPGPHHLGSELRRDSWRPIADAARSGPSGDPTAAGRAHADPAGRAGERPATRSGGARPLHPGALLVEQAGTGTAQVDPAGHQGARSRCDVCPGLFRDGGRLRPARLREPAFPQRRVPQGGGRRAPCPAVGLHARRAACHPRVRQNVLLLGLGRRGSGIPTRACFEPELRDRSRLVRPVPHGDGPV